MFLEHLEETFKTLHRKELTNDLTLQFLPSVNYDLFFFVTGVGCEIECVRATESTDKIWMISFPEEKQISNLQ